MTLEFARIGFAPNVVDYETGWTRQRELHHEIVSGTRTSTVLLLEHAAVYTGGKRTEAGELPYDGTPVISVDRGGKLTWHGPGQLVCYPIVALADPIDVVGYVRVLEESILAVLRGVGITGALIEGRSGVWLPADDRGVARKIAAVGIRVANGVSMHGFALNCNNDLRPFGKIVPCGITDASVTSIAEETGRDISPADIASSVEEQLRERERLFVRPDVLAHQGKVLR